MGLAWAGSPGRLAKGNQRDEGAMRNAAVILHRIRHHLEYINK